MHDVIAIWTPAARHSRVGNRVTALRIAGLLRRHGRRVRIGSPLEPVDGDVLIALHARKSAEVVLDWRARRPAAPIVVLVAGTDLYVEQADPRVAEVLAAATRVVVLQPNALQRLPAAVRAHAVAILQSARRAPGAPVLDPRHYDIVQLAHLRDVKAPRLAAEAARALPATSRVRILHAGAALDASAAAAARDEMQRNPRYHWLGPLQRLQALRLLRDARAFVQTSVVEGGSNAIAEALVSHLPVLATRNDGTLGQLGDAHPGYFEVGARVELSALYLRIENEPEFEQELRARSRALAEACAPEREAAAWLDLLDTLT
jgi:putative glycosyltransferase (TIGR04348 family)